ncbi:MAG TPA: 3-methyl-2-oxobutanoate dehydrogenase subunit beta, partial [Clostridia bacterium]|nr:3-methyl-2-oxobutanoate dehydrogenase subunit beta [Clostridia bacterium]
GNKRPHNVINSLYLTPQSLEALVKKRFKKYETIKKEEQKADEYLTDDADYIIVAYGASSRISRTAVNLARKEGIKAGLIRPITLWPYPDMYIEKHISHAKAFLCVEMSMGQMVDDVRLCVNGRKPVAFYGRTGGIIPSPDEVLSELRKLAGGKY